MKVYDLLNAGPRKRFMVRGADKRPFIVSNCENIVQATARDVFAECLLRLDDAGYKVPLNVHDEAVPEVLLSVTTDTIQKIMSQAPAWMSDLPVASKCTSTLYYTK